MFKLIIFTILFSACASTQSPTSKVELMQGKSKNQYEAFGKDIMISTQGEQTTLASKKIYEQGGNLVDVALAASFAISVERPHSSGLGGGGFWLSYSAKTGEAEAFDFREQAPLRSHAKIFLDKNGRPIDDKSLTGGLAVGVPGLVAGLLQIHREKGKLPLAQIMAPAIEMAENGIVIYPALFEAMTEERERLAKFQSTAKIFLDDNLKPWPVGHVLVQKDLAKTLRLIARHGHDVFYKGQLAQQIVKSVKANGGIISKQDLQDYKVIKRKPIEGEAFGAKIVSMPPPSSGGTHIIEILKVLEKYPLKEWGAQSAQTIHTVSSAMQLAFVDRARYMGDSDFVNVPLEEILLGSHISKLQRSIRADRANRAEELEAKNMIQIKESDHTIHFSFMDGEGNAIVSTQTINGWFGSALVAEGTGIVLNNEMDDFATHVGGSNLFGAVGGKNNLIAPKKRPLSSMSPTVVIDSKNKRLMALGTPSGTRILTCVMQTILNYLEFDQNLWDSVAMARYHHQWRPDHLVIERPFVARETEKKLKQMGHKIKHEDLYCSIQAIELEQGQLHGVSDPREEGMSWGI